MWKEKGPAYERALQDWMMNALPKKDRAIDQIIVANLLSTPTIQRLGDNLERFHLSSLEVRSCVHRFVSDLRAFPKEDDLFMLYKIYPYLIPDSIAQSISI